MSEADKAASANPILVMVDEDTGERFARAVGQKGVGAFGSMDWLIRDITEELQSWGHAGGEGGHFIFKSDGEPSIVALRTAVAKYVGGRVIPEDIPRGESQSNGTAEEAGKTVREYVRVLKEQVEDKASVKLSPDSNLTQWMVRWAAMLYSRYAAGRDGKTPYERRRGRPLGRVPAVCFGEVVWYKELRVGKERQNKFDTEWREGLWLGQARSSNESVIGTMNGVVRAYTVKRHGPERQWSADLVRGLAGTPQQPNPNVPGHRIPIRVNFDDTPHADDTPVVGPVPIAQRQIRRMKITTALLQKYGYTAGCEGCRFKEAGMGEARNHTDACRLRITTAMDQDDEGRRHLSLIHI